MLLVSTLRNFANELTPLQVRERYEAAMSAVRVEHLQLEPRDKANTLLNASRETIDVVSDEELLQALAAVQLEELVVRIRQRANMITPVDEWQVLGNYEHNRIGSNRNGNGQD